MMNTRIYDPRGECDPGATIRKLRIVQTEGSRQVDNARYIKRNRVTDEISWPPSEMMAQLREAGLVS